MLIVKLLWTCLYRSCRQDCAHKINSNCASIISFIETRSSSKRRPTFRQRAPYVITLGLKSTLNEWTYMYAFLPRIICFVKLCNFFFASFHSQIRWKLLGWLQLFSHQIILRGMQLIETEKLWLHYPPPSRVTIIDLPPPALDVICSHINQHQAIALSQTHSQFSYAVK